MCANIIRSILGGGDTAVATKSASTVIDPAKSDGAVVKTTSNDAVDGPTAKLIADKKKVGVPGLGL